MTVAADRRASAPGRRTPKCREARQLALYRASSALGLPDEDSRIGISNHDSPHPLSHAGLRIPGPIETGFNEAVYDYQETICRMGEDPGDWADIVHRATGSSRLDHWPNRDVGELRRSRKQERLNHDKSHILWLHKGFRGIGLSFLPV